MSDPFRPTPAPSPEQPKEKFRKDEPTSMLIAPGVYVWVEVKGEGLYRATAHHNGVEVAAAMGDTRPNAINALLLKLIQNTGRLRELEKTAKKGTEFC